MLDESISKANEEFDCETASGYVDKESNVF